MVTRTYIPFTMYLHYTIMIILLTMDSFTSVFTVLFTTLSAYTRTHAYLPLLLPLTYSTSLLYYSLYTIIAHCLVLFPRFFRFCSSVHVEICTFKIGKRPYPYLIVHLGIKIPLLN